jgi:hypothetical protein
MPDPLCRALTGGAVTKSITAAVRITAVMSVHCFPLSSEESGRAAPFGGYRNRAPVAKIPTGPVTNLWSSSMSKTAAEYMAQAFAQAGIKRICDFLTT